MDGLVLEKDELSPPALQPFEYLLSPAANLLFTAQN